ncbi:MAG: hypothetical protein HIU82_06410 [Proteobacteria bacterium]|nr:hypothetical protein [Pseudomonadota bacterium]
MLYGHVVEQIDGASHVDGLSCLVEAKDAREAISTSRSRKSEASYCVVTPGSSVSERSCFERWCLRQHEVGFVPRVSGGSGHGVRGAGAAGADDRLGEFEPMRSLISFLRTKGPNAGDEPPHH